MNAISSGEWSQVFIDGRQKELEQLTYWLKIGPWNCICSSLRHKMHDLKCRTVKAKWSAHLHVHNPNEFTFVDFISPRAICRALFALGTFSFSVLRRIRYNMIMMVTSRFYSKKKKKQRTKYKIWSNISTAALIWKNLNQFIFITAIANHPLLFKL